MSTPWLIAFLGLWMVVLVEGTLLLGVFRRVSVVLEAAEGRLRELPSRGPGGLPVGARVPPFSASTAYGLRFGDADLRDKFSLVLFLSTGCAPCSLLADDLNESHIGGAHLVLVLNDPSDALGLGLSGAAEHVYQSRGEVSQAFLTTATPHAFLIDPGGVVLASGTPNSHIGLRRLVEEGMKGGGQLAVPEALRF